ncbi:hypothetical protein B7494_g2081 [Chlorociboria aeruginascens]|nr:hypothetical protein B7494_g2081 [Chlorociboria aeruginascens]
MTSAWQIHPSAPYDQTTTDGIANLHLAKDIPKPSPSAKTALVRIRAAALNAREMMVISHVPFYLKHIPDLVPCADGAGVIEEVGAGSKWKVGDRVLLLFMTGWPEGDDSPDALGMKALGAGDVQGTLREYAVVDDENLLRAPEHLSLTETAAIPLAGGTSINVLFYGPTPVKRGTIVLTQGATVIATSSSDSKLAALKKLGATHVINYKTTPNWGSEVLRLTNGRGVDHVVDVAGSGSIEESLKATKQGGLISVVGALSRSKQVDIIPAVLVGGKTLRGVFGVRKDMMERLVDFVEKNKIHPQVAQVFKWEDAKSAFEALVAQNSIGKIVIEVG